MEKKIGYEVVKVRGNTSYTIEVYKTKDAALGICKAMTDAAVHSADDVIVYFEVRETRIY
jgi:hypothetical protein